jgi:hypothetical protein
MSRAATSGNADGTLNTTALMRARTPASLVPSASRLTLTVTGSWEAAETAVGVDEAAAIAARSGSIVVALPPGQAGEKRPALAATRASHFSDADGASADFSFSVSWYNLTVLPAGETLTVQSVTRGGRFVNLRVKLELAWIAPPADASGSGPEAPPASPSPSPSPLPSPSPSPSPPTKGGRPEDESTTVITTPSPVHLDPAIPGGDANLTSHALLNFTVPPGFNPSNNRIELWTRGEWLAEAGAGAPLGVVGIAHNGSLLAYVVASHYASQDGRSANFSFGTTFGNVSLPPGAVAELWGGVRGGHFHGLSASASLKWASAPLATGPPQLQLPGANATGGSVAPAIEQTASVGMAASRSFSAPADAAGKPVMAPILNFTAPPNFDPQQNMVEMWLTGQWDNTTGNSDGAVAPANANIGGVALMRGGQVLAFTFPSDEAKARGGEFFYGAVWRDVGLPSDGGVVEVWAGMQGGSFKGLKVNITLKWMPGDLAASMPLEPSATAPVQGNPLAGGGPLVPQPLPAAPSRAPAPGATAPAVAAADLSRSGSGAVEVQAADDKTAGGDEPAKQAGGPAPAKATGASAPPPAKECSQKLRPWDQCGERVDEWGGVPTAECCDTSSYASSGQSFPRVADQNPHIAACVQPTPTKRLRNR